MKTTSYIKNDLKNKDKAELAYQNIFANQHEYILSFEQEIR